MTYLFIEPGLHICGGIRRIVEIATRLRNLGHIVYVASPKGRACTWLDSNFIPIKLANIKEFSKKHKIDICIFNLADQYTEAKAVTAAIKIFWVLAPEAMYKNPEIPIKALNCGFNLLSNSSFTVSYIKKYARNYKDNITIIPGGINKTHFKYDSIIPKIYHVMYYGSSRPWKGAQIIERALTPLQLRLHKMNTGNMLQTQMYKLYASATCYVSAGQIEGFNFPILEAMACGCPVVCTSDGGSADFVKDGINAIVVNRTVEGISKGVRRILGDKDLRRKLKQGGLETASAKKYNWDVVTKQFSDYAENLLYRE